MSTQRFESETTECRTAMYAAGAEFERGDDYIIVYTGADIPVKPVPECVTPRQIRLALTASGLRTAVENAVKNGDQDFRDWWEYALEIDRSHPLIGAMAKSLGVTDQQLDDLFRKAGAR